MIYTKSDLDRTDTWSWRGGYQRFYFKGAKVITQCNEQDWINVTLADDCAVVWGSKNSGEESREGLVTFTIDGLEYTYHINQEGYSINKKDTPFLKISVPSTPVPYQGGTVTVNVDYNEYVDNVTLSTVLEYSVENSGHTYTISIPENEETLQKHFTVQARGITSSGNIINSTSALIHQEAAPAKIASLVITPDKDHIGSEGGTVTLTVTKQENVKSIDEWTVINGELNDNKDGTYTLTIEEYDFGRNVLVGFTGTDIWNRPVNAQVKVIQDAKVLYVYYNTESTYPKTITGIENAPNRKKIERNTFEQAVYGGDNCIWFAFPNSFEITKIIDSLNGLDCHESYLENGTALGYCFVGNYILYYTIVHGIPFDSTLGYTYHIKQK